MPANSGIRNKIVKGTPTNPVEAKNSTLGPRRSGPVENGTITSRNSNSGPRTNLKGGK